MGKDLSRFRVEIYSISINGLNTNIEKYVIRMTDQDQFENSVVHDNLHEDPPIPGQRWALFSFVTPKNFEKVVEKCDEEGNVILDNEGRPQYERIPAPEDLSKIYCVKFRGAFATEKEAEERANMLRKRDPNHNIYVSDCVGKWIPSNPDPEDAENSIFMGKNSEEQQQIYEQRRKTEKLEQMNTALSKWDDQVSEEKKEFQRHRKEQLRKAIAEKRNARKNTTQETTRDRVNRRVASRKNKTKTDIKDLKDRLSNLGNDM